MTLSFFNSLSDTAISLSTQRLLTADAEIASPKTSRNDKDQRRLAMTKIKDVS